MQLVYLAVIILPCLAPPTSNSITSNALQSNALSRGMHQQSANSPPINLLDVFSDLTNAIYGHEDHVNTRHSASVDHMATEIYELWSRFLTALDSGNTFETLIIAEKFDASAKKTLLEYSYFKHKWEIAKIMLNRGYDPQLLLKHLRHMPRHEAVYVLDSIDYYGLYIQGNNIKYKKPEDKNIRMNDLMVDRFRLYRVVSADIDKAKKSISRDMLKLFDKVHPRYPINSDDIFNQIMKFNDFEKSLLLAGMIMSNRWGIALRLILNNVDQRYLKRLLDNFPDAASVEAYLYLYSEWAFFDLISVPHDDSIRRLLAYFRNYQLMYDENPPTLHLDSNINENQKSILLAYLIYLKQWDNARALLSLGYPQGLMNKLLRYYPDGASVDAYMKLGLIPHFIEIPMHASYQT